MIFEIDRDTNLFYRVWEPESAPVADIIIVHGYAEHSGRYEHAGRYFSDSGFRVFAFDHPGHGQSPGKKALVSSIFDLSVNLNHFVKYIKNGKNNKKIFIIGHSMGGVVAALYSAAFGSDISGVITSGAAVITMPVLWPPLRATLDYLSGFFPEAPTIKLPADKLSRDKKVVDDYMADQLTYRGKVKLKTAVELSKAVKIIKKKARFISEPLLVLHGAEDRLASPDGSRLLFENASSADKELKIFDNLRHEIFNEPEKQIVLETVKNWITARL